MTIPGTGPFLQLTYRNHQDMRTKFLPFTAIWILLLAVWPVCAAETIELAAGVHRIEAEVAHTFDLRAKGLMQRRSLPANGGMFFVFPEQMEHCMWMRNTLIPLSVAFIDGHGAIVNIEEMQPQSDENHCAKTPARYALEMNGKWFSSHGIKAGMKISGIERAPPPR